MNNIEISHELLGRLTRGEYAAALELVSPDFVCVEAENMPFAGRYTGKDGFLELMGKLFDIFNDFELIDITADGDYVVLQVTMIRRTETGELRMPLSEVWYMPDGMLTDAVPCYYDPGIVQDFLAGKSRTVYPDAFHRPMEHGDGNREQNIEAVKALLTKAASGDWAGAEPYIHEDFAVIESGSTPYAGEYRGYEGFPKILQALRDAWGEEQSFSIDNVIADDRRVFMIETLRGTLGQTPTEMYLCEMWEMDGGKVRRVVPYYFDSKKMGDLHAQGASKSTVAA